MGAARPPTPHTYWPVRFTRMSKLDLLGSSRSPFPTTGQHQGRLYASRALPQVLPESTLQNPCLPPPHTHQMPLPPPFTVPAACRVSILLRSEGSEIVLCNSGRAWGDTLHSLVGLF